MSTLSQPRTSNSQPRLSASTVGAASMHTQPRRLERAPVAASSIDPLKVLRRYLWTILASGVIGAILGLSAFLLLQQTFPRYSGMVVFNVRPGLQKSTDIGTVDATNDDMVFRVAQTEAYLLTSRDVLEAALKNPDVQNTAWGRQFHSNNAFNHMAALEDLEEDVGTSVRRSSNLFMLHWSARKPADVPVVLNAIAAAYSNRAKLREAELYNDTLTLFESQLRETQSDLEDINQDIGNLIVQSGMTSLDDTRWSAQMFQMQEVTRTGTMMQTELNLALSGLQLVRQQIDGRVEPNAEDQLDAEQDPTLFNFSESVNFAGEQYRTLRAQFQENNPQVINAYNTYENKKLELQKRVHDIMLRNLSAKAQELENDVKRLEAAVDANQKVMDINARTLKELAGKQAQLEQLTSQREYLQERRASDLELVTEVTLIKARKDATRVEQAQIAYTPREPSFPRIKIVVPLGILLMMALTTGVIFLRELLDKRVKSASDLALVPGARVLGSLPDSGDDPTRITTPELVVRRQPSSVLAESYRQVATTILPELDAREAQTLLLVGGLPDAGTTTVATNLAMAAATTGRSVLLVDANFRRPGLGKALGISDDAIGLGDVLTSAVAVDEAIHDSGEGVEIMPAGTPVNRVIERLNNGVIDGVLADLRSRYDLIIFDAPPAVIAGDAMMLANKLDAAILVVRANQEHRGLVARMISRLTESRCQLVGVLLNRPRNIAGGYLKKNYAAMAEYSKSDSGA